MKFDRRDAELLFQVLTERDETNSHAIASNQPLRLDPHVHRPTSLRRGIDRLTYAGQHPRG
ncbi:hypothetical protein AB0E55_19125 [Amycolatopsis keratiniphila]|uniref:hypothetical protein n=1 Tax=Amycolatopsis keratiniphila TaxID=129921 RepID=UPI0033F863B9